MPSGWWNICFERASLKRTVSEAAYKEINVMRFKPLINLRRRLASKLIFVVGLTLLVTISTWAYFNINYQKKKLMGNIVTGTDRLPIPLDSAPITP